ncbi:succinate dehydrogenase [ubiquinone] cytochrome b small subunit, mitochondrial [Hydra vulgaris]|uniref:Succinate dehydrogenase [ubiquinone] cytochrome b small subunit n=1 Tax=Hydra vulgaris TaxID=6087 RepID=T2MIS9_HYDVU|nr:succinate dehydrogenase [ubiquinone] cytochrome b small subunit, mitochondrial isoform X1 [Hydra vulgaris]
MAVCTLYNAAIRFGRPKFSMLKGVTSERLRVKLVLPSSSSLIEKKRVYHTSVKNLSQKFALPNDPSHGSKHWMTERVVAVGLLGLIPMGIIYPLPTIDHLLAVALPLHSYWGVKAILVDYFWRPGLPVAKATWMLACFFTCGGLIYLNVYDVGICKFFALLMSL